MNKYIPYLDSLRAAAVLIVIGRHYGVSEYIPGGFGVTVFFFISGFLITTLLVSEEDANGFISISSFYIRRFVRLTPPLLLVLIVTVPIYFLLFGERFDLLQVIFGATYLGNIHNILVDYKGFSGGLISYRIFWSLAIEEHFYLIFPVVLILFKSPLHRKVIVISGLLFSVIFRGLSWYVLDDAESFNYHFTLSRIDSILYGVLFALIYRDKECLNNAGKKHMHSGVLMGAFVVLLIAFLWRESFFQSVIKYSFQGVALYMIFHILFATDFCKSFFVIVDCSLLQSLGRISYEMYLWHYPVYHMVTFFIDGFPAVLSAFIATITVSLLSKKMVNFLKDKNYYFKVVTRGG